MQTLPEYTSLTEGAEFEFTEKKSIFIGNACPVKTEREALEFVGSIKKRYADARHNVYAYRLRENQIARFSDDGEPHGTAGMPVLDVLRKSDITDAAVVVTRYFGGILLGTGGLVRAYSKAASGAVENAGITLMIPCVHLDFSLSYPDYSKAQSLFERSGIKIENAEFSGDVKLTVGTEKENEENLRVMLSEMTAGKVEISETRYGYFPRTVKK